MENTEPHNLNQTPSQPLEPPQQQTNEQNLQEVELDFDNFDNAEQNDVNIKQENSNDHQKEQQIKPLSENVDKELKKDNEIEKLPNEIKKESFEESKNAEQIPHEKDQSLKETPISVESVSKKEEENLADTQTHKVNNEETTPIPTPSSPKIEKSDVSNIESNANGLPNTEIKPTLIIKEAQKERIGTTLNLFIDYMNKHKLNMTNQKSVILNVCEEIDRRKANKYTWYHLLKEYFVQCQSIAKLFHETSYKFNKEEKVGNINKHLNMGEEMKEAYDELIFLRKESGNDFHRFDDYIAARNSIELESVFNRYISEMNQIQSEVLEKKKICFDYEAEFKKKVQKLTRVYNKGKEGKEQDEDVFVETCKFIQLERDYRKSVIVWGKSLIDLREVIVACEIKLNDDVQNVLNSFKNASSGLYGFHKTKFESIIASNEEVIRENRYSQLCGLQDRDYIKYALLTSSKVQITSIEDRQFEEFLEMNHFEILAGKSEDLLKGMVNKSFLLKNKDEELVNTVSGNLVQINTITSQYKEKFNVKNLEATIIGDGVVQFDEIMPGIIFKDTRTIRIAFRDQDRAEELICLLNEN